MQKTKLGISVGLLGAAIYFMGLFSGYLIVFVLAGYVLLCEENSWLRKCAVKAVFVMAVFSLTVAVLNLVPDIFSFINNIFSMFGGSFYVPFISNLINAIVVALNFIEKLLMIGLGVKALNQGTIAVPVIDKLISKYMG